MFRTQPERERKGHPRFAFFSIILSLPPSPDILTDQVVVVKHETPGIFNAEILNAYNYSSNAV
jgi:hypothetical protein